MEDLEIIHISNMNYPQINFNIGHINKQKGVPVMTAEEKRIYKSQIVKMCIQTYFNMYGVMPGTSELVEWLGDDYANIVTLYMNEQKAA